MSHRFRVFVKTELSVKVFLKIILVKKDTRVSCSAFLHCDDRSEAYFGKGTKLTVLGKLEVLKLQFTATNTVKVFVEKREGKNCFCKKAEVLS